MGSSRPMSSDDVSGGASRNHGIQLLAIPRREVREHAGARELGEHLTVGRQHAPDLGDPPSHADQPSEQIPLRAKGRVVESLDLPLELLGGLQIRVHVPVQDGDEELYGAQPADLTVVLNPLPALFEKSDRGAVRRDHPIVTDEDAEGAGLVIELHAWSTHDDLDGSRPHRRQRRLGIIVEELAGCVRERERSDHRLDVALRRIRHVHPEQLVVSEPSLFPGSNVDGLVVTTGPRVHGDYAHARRIRNRSCS